MSVWFVVELWTMRWTAIILQIAVAGLRALFNMSIHVRCGTTVSRWVPPQINLGWSMCAGVFVEFGIWAPQLSVN